MVLGARDREWIEARALAAGFDAAGMAAVPEPESTEAQRADARFSGWVGAERAGEMEWLKRTDAEGRLLRGELRRALPWARTVLVCALNYDADAPLSIEPAEAGAGWIARYAWSGRAAESGGEASLGSDYHDVLLAKLRMVEEQLQQRFGAEVQTRAYVDTGPIVEREFAARAGVGWIGKNTCVLNEQQGSWLLLGVVITSLEVAAEARPEFAADRCGSCTRCIDACPTDALVAPREMDASRCIAYLTIEKKGSVAEELRAGMGRQVFGCDICQDLCPWNAKARRVGGGRRGADALPPRRELVNPALGWLAAMDGREFNRWFRGSPLERTRRKRVLRNVAIAMGNSGETEFLPQLEAWATGEDPVLAEAATWAAARLRAGAAATPYEPSQTESGRT